MTNVAVPRAQWGLTIVLSIALAVGMLCSFIMLLPLFRFIVEAHNGYGEWWRVLMVGTYQISIVALPIGALCLRDRKVRTRFACLAAWLILVFPIAFILLKAALTQP